METPKWRASVGEPIARRREELGLSVRQAAKLAGISESQWRQVESGRRPIKGGSYEPVAPKDETLAAMSAALRWDPGRGINALISGGRPKPLVGGQIVTPAMLHPRPGAVEDRLALLEDEVRTLMRIVLQIQNERATDERRDSLAGGEATQSAP